MSFYLVFYSFFSINPKCYLLSFIPPFLLSMEQIVISLSFVYFFFFTFLGAMLILEIEIYNPDL